MACMINHTASMTLTTMELGVTETNTSSLRPEACNANLPARGQNTEKVTSHDIYSDSNATIVWSLNMQILVLSSFLWGYLITQVPGGWLSERFGGKVFFGWSIFACGILTFFIPLAAEKDYRAVTVIRFFLGVLQGVVWPAMNVIWSRWAPPLERQKLTSLCYAGSVLGIVITFPSSAILCETGGWSSIFYISGSLGILWFFAWRYLVYDSPELHPYISEEERAYICYSLRKYIKMPIQTQQDTPWKAMLTSSAVWGVLVTLVCSDFGLYTILSYVTTFLHDVHYFSYFQIAMISALIYIGYFLATVISGTLYDTVLTRKLCTRTMARKVGNTIGMLIPGFLIFCVGFIDCTHREVAAALLVLSGTVSGFTYGAGFLTSFSDIAPQHTGILFGFGNTLSTALYMMIPYFIAYMTADHILRQWRIVFIVTAGFCFFGSIVFITYGSGNVQDWAKVKRTHEVFRDTSTPRSVSQSDDLKTEKEQPYQVEVIDIPLPADSLYQVDIPIGRIFSSPVDPPTQRRHHELQEGGPVESVQV